MSKFIKLSSVVLNTRFIQKIIFRENAYEATFNKNAKGTTPTMVSKEKGSGLTGILGLTSISTTDAVNKDGKSLKIKIN